MIEFYLKQDRESIEYGIKHRIKKISSSYQVNLKWPLSLFP